MLYSTNGYTQQNDLAKKAIELVYSNPDESIKIAQHILRTSNNLQEKSALNLLISKGYLVKGDYNKAVLFAFNKENHLEGINEKTQVDHYILKAKILRKLYLDKQSKNYLLKAKNLNKNSSEIVNILEQINMHIDRHENNEAIVAINK